VRNKETMEKVSDATLIEQFKKNYNIFQKYKMKIAKLNY